MRDDDRYLKRRGKKNRFYYYRRVPSDVEAHDPRGVVELSLKTSDLFQAQKRRDAQELADDALWAAMRRGHSQTDLEEYQAASKLARALGFDYVSADELARQPLQQIYKRTAKVMENGPPQPGVVAALLGGVASPVVTVRQAFEIYFDELTPHEKLNKSPAQYKMWRKVKCRARDNFVKVVGDEPISDISRQQGQRFYQFWQRRIETEGLSASAANRDLGNMRVVFRDYHKYIGDEDRPNPFRGLSFSERGKKKRKRPAFTVHWIRSRLLVTDALGPLNREAALIFYTVIDTGCRPSEIANLKSHCIQIDHAVPHIRIQPEADAAHKREIKTETSERVIPLVGVALEAMKLAPDGFPRYFDKETNLSGILMKQLRRLGLLETEKHSAYSLRHSFEDRMTEAGLDYELRCELMGHDTDRPDYGEGGSLEWKRDQLMKIVLPFPADLLARYAETRPAGS